MMLATIVLAALALFYTRKRATSVGQYWQPFPRAVARILGTLPVTCSACSLDVARPGRPRAHYKIAVRPYGSIQGVPGQIGYRVTNQHNATAPDLSGAACSPASSRRPADGLDDGAHTRARKRTYAFIRAYCDVCPLSTKDACTQLGAHDLYGTWGGVPAHERIARLVAERPELLEEHRADVVAALVDSAATDIEVASILGVSLTNARRILGNQRPDKAELMADIERLGHQGKTQGQIAYLLDVPVELVKSYRKHLRVAAEQAA